MVRRLTGYSMKEHDVSTWPPDMRFLYEERAGIIEFEGYYDRASAESIARRLVWKQCSPKQGALAL